MLFPLKPQLSCSSTSQRGVKPGEFALVMKICKIKPLNLFPFLSLQGRKNRSAKRRPSPGESWYPPPAGQLTAHLRSNVSERLLRNIPPSACARLLLQVEKRLDLVKQVTHSTHKKLTACLQGQQGADTEKRSVKSPSVSGSIHLAFRRARMQR